MKSPVYYCIAVFFFSVWMYPAAAQSWQITSTSHPLPVVELYTSEGCSSCPPADRWLSKLVEKPDIDAQAVVLAFHVDYWDYIGWKERFADPKYTARQRKLARSNRQSSIYTPEFMVNRIEARGTGNVIKRIGEAAELDSELDLLMKLTRDQDSVEIKLDTSTPTDEPLLVEFVVYEDNLDSQVKAGENRGRHLYHDRVVRSLSPALKLKDSIGYSIKLAKDWKIGDTGIAALVFNAEGRHLQALQTRIR